MKFLYLCSDMGIRPDGSKGASIHVRAITKALSDLGHDLRLLSPHPAPGGDHPAKPVLIGRSTGSFEPVDRLRSWLKQRELQVTPAEELRSLLYNGWVVDQALPALAADPPDVIVERLSLFGHAGLDLSIALGRPLVIEANALVSREARRFRQLALADLAGQIEQRVLKRADAVLAVSSELRESILAMDVDPAHVHVVPNGADVDRFDIHCDGAEVRRRLGFASSVVFGFIGSLKTWHGVDLLVSAFERLAAGGVDAKLLIVGSGPTESQLREQVLHAGLQGSVHFTGAVSHDEIPALLSATDIAVAPFRNVEGFYFSPIKLFEYMAAGRCIVATRLGQIEQVICDGEHGLLCRPDDIDDLAAVMERAFRDAEMRRRLASAARTRVEREFTWQVAAESVCRVVRGLIERHPRACMDRTAVTSSATTDHEHAAQARCRIVG